MKSKQALAAAAACALLLALGNVAQADDSLLGQVVAPVAASSAPQAAGGDAAIQTGDASSSASAENDLNVNVADSGSASTSVSNDNAATLDAGASSTAQTGGNAAQAPGGSASVVSGNALSSANIINVVNANIVDSQGLLAFLNAFFGAGFDLRGLFDSAATNSADCSLSSCDAPGTSLTVNNDNSATVTNAVLSVASTGGNAASSTGDASVSTGNAAASANVLNVVNTNITDSNYLLIALNNFGDLSGDITLPGAAFFEQLLSRGGAGGSTSVSNDNRATLNATTTAQADSGGNTASGQNASVQTGSALSSATTYNQVNTDQTGGATVFLLVRVFGNWTGAINGLPAGLSWMQTPDGIAIVGGAGALSSLGSASTSVSDANQATVNNDVQVYALTGGNYAGSATGTASIATGNAYATADVVNLVNTNVIGENWILAIMNIFGDWNGDLDFGKPDLWLGAVAQTPDPAPPGSHVTYTFTVSNRGDADATGVVLNASFDKNIFAFSTGTSTDAGVSWYLGTIPAGATEQYSFTASVAPGAPQGNAVESPLSASVQESDADADASDNTDTVTILVGTQLPSMNTGMYLPYAASPKLSISKTESVTSTTTPGSVEYRVVVDDDAKAGPAYNATLTDAIVGSAGNAVYRNSWDLDTINPGDEITLDYTVQFGASTTPGTYVNTSTVTGGENYPQPQYANPLPPLSTSTSVDLLDPPQQGEVLGASTTIPNVPCAPLLTSFIEPGAANDPGAVKSLQLFLSGFEHDPVMPTGVYDAPTEQYVKAFQQAYAGDILQPWGISKPTGSVYYTTQRKINDEYCQGSAQFPLTAAQLQEIAAFRARDSK